MTQPAPSPPPTEPGAPADTRPTSPPAPPRSDSNFVPSSRYRPETGCAASADRRGDPLFATAPPAERWLLIELNAPWPRAALTALRHSTPAPRTPQADLNRTTPQTAASINPADNLPTEIAQLCAQLRCRPVLIRRHGRTPANAPRRWFLVDSRPGHESIRTGELPTDEHLLAVLSGADQGTPHTDPIYLVCTHGRHDACCAVRGRPAAAALTAAYPDRTWECSHIGGDRFAANLVFLPHSLFYGHVPADQAVPLAQSYDKGTITPTYYRGSGALTPPAQAAQHFARTAGHSLALAALRPESITQPAPNHWSVTLSTPPTSAASDGPLGPDSSDPLAVPDRSRTITVEVRADMITVNGQMTCAAKPSGQVRQFTLAAPIDAAATAPPPPSTPPPPPPPQPPPST
jgi:hypothetical protein